MSLELAIQENTQALRELAQMIQAMQAPRIAVPEGIKAEDIGEPGPVVEKPEPKKAKAKKEVAQAPQGKPESAPSAPSTGSGAIDASVTEAAVAPAVSRQDVSVALTMVSAKKGRDASMQILKQVGAASLKAAQESDYPAILCACELALS